MSEQFQVFTPGRGINYDGSITEGTAQRGLLTSQIVQAGPADIVAIDFSGKHHFSQKPPIGGATEAVGMFGVALDDGMPTYGVRIGLDIEADDTVSNYICGIEGGDLDPKLDTLVAIHRDHWPRVQWMGSLIVPHMRLIPAFVEGGYSSKDLLMERALLAGYKHVMRNVTPGDFDGIRAANGRIRNAYQQAQGEEVSWREKLHHLRELWHSEG